MMRILILGSGGRECTFAWKLAQELPKENIFITPGNAGTAAYGTNLNLSILDFEAIRRPGKPIAFIPHLTIENKV